MVSHPFALPWAMFSRKTPRNFQQLLNNRFLWSLSVGCSKLSGGRNAVSLPASAHTQIFSSCPRRALAPGQSALKRRPEN